MPDLIDLLFLRSFPDPFERVKRDKKLKLNEKEAKISMKIQ